MGHPLFLQNLFSVKAGKYEHFVFDETSAASARNIILAFCIGIILASLYVLYQKSVSGRLVRNLLKAEANSKETAKTLAELGCLKNPFIRHEAFHGSSLKKILVRVCEGEEDAPQKEGEKPAKIKPNPEKDRFYIPEEFKFQAENRFDNKGNGPLSFVITAVLTVVLAVAIMKLLPLFLLLVDSIL